MNPKLARILNFVRLIDENGDLSITNIAVITMVVKIAMAPQIDLAAAALLLPALSAYVFKHYTKPKATTAIDELAKTVKEHTMSIEKLKIKGGMFNG